MATMRLLLIEDDRLLGEGLRDYLRGDGHAVEWARGLGEADALRGEPFDAWLVDWQLPDGSGLAWLRAMRRRPGAEADTPALMLTARDQLEDRLQGLDSGADDYLVKPFAPEELAARLRAVTRRRAGSGQSRLLLGAAALQVQIDLSQRSAWRAGQRVELTAREWTVLEALALRNGRLVPKPELERLMLGFDSEVASNALEVHVSSLRRKLGRELIETARGLGYRIGAAA